MGTAPLAALRPRPAAVLVAGAGVAGLEAALALREFAGPAAEVSVIDTRARFALPAVATGRAFGHGAGVDLPLAEVVAAAGARLVDGRLAGVDPLGRTVTLAGGRRLGYDILVVAVGARADAVVPGALTFTGAADEGAELVATVDDVADLVRAGGRPELVFLVPPGCAWPLPAYELALMSRHRLREAGAGGASVSVVTPEPEPLAVFGERASEAVASVMRREDITVRVGCTAYGWQGRRLVTDRVSLEADRLVALPVLRGPAIAGLPSDPDGFLLTDRDGAVRGTPDVWGAGDGVAHPVKQGEAACAQADAVAAHIARELGADVPPLPYSPGLTGWMWDGRDGCELRTRYEPRPPAGLRGSAGWPAAKAPGRFLPTLLAGVTA